MLNKTKAAMPGRQWYTSKRIENDISTLIDQVNARSFAHISSNYGKNTLVEADQLFGSTPRAISSLRKMRFIQVARDESPSFRISSSNCERNSSLRRIWYCGDFFNSCIDICNYPNYYSSVITRVITFLSKSNAPECVNTTEASDHKPLIEVTVMAGSQHTQTHPKFTWRFLALSASARNVIHITAATEREARDQSPAGCVMVFAGRLPLQGVRHA